MVLSLLEVALTTGGIKSSPRHSLRLPYRLTNKEHYVHYVLYLHVVIPACTVLDAGILIMVQHVSMMFS